MTKWDTIQSDLAPVTPKYWGDELDDEREEDLFDEDDMPYLDGDLTLDWED